MFARVCGRCEWKAESADASICGQCGGPLKTSMLAAVSEPTIEAESPSDAPASSPQLPKTYGRMGLAIGGVVGAGVMPFIAAADPERVPIIASVLLGMIIGAAIGAGIGFTMRLDQFFAWHPGGTKFYTIAEEEALRPVMARWGGLAGVVIGPLVICTIWLQWDPPWWDMAAIPIGIISGCLAGAMIGGSIGRLYGELVLADESRERAKGTINRTGKYRELS